MKAGVIGIVSGSLGRLQSFTTTRTVDGRDLNTRIEVTGVRQTKDGLELTAGRAARERLTDRESVQLNGNGITVTDESAVTTEYTEFIVADGDFVVVQNGTGTFLFETLEREYGVTVTRGAIDLDALLAAFEDGTPWKVGFRGHTDVAEKGVIHGASVLSDEMFGDALRTAEKNQLGLEFPYNGSSMKMMATASGYVEVYHPRNFDGNQFCEFLQTDVIPITNTDNR